MRTTKAMKTAVTGVMMDAIMEGKEGAAARVAGNTAWVTFPDGRILSVEITGFDGFNPTWVKIHLDGDGEDYPDYDIEHSDWESLVCMVRLQLGW